MPSPLIGTPVTKSVNAHGADDARRREGNRRVALDAFKTDVAVKVIRTRSSNGIGQLLAGAYPEPSPAPMVAKKADHGPLHPRAKAVANMWIGVEEGPR